MGLCAVRNVDASSPHELRRVRLTFISLWDAGEGLSTYTMNLRAALESLGVVCDVIPYSDDLLTRKGRRDVAAMVTTNGGIVHVQHEFSLYGDWRDPFDDRFARLLKALPAPVVTTAHSFHPYLLRLDRRRPHPPFQTAKRVARWCVGNSPWGRRNFAAVFRLGDAVIVHNQFHRQHLRRFGVQAEVIPHGVPASPVLPSHTTEVWQRRLASQRVVTVAGFVLYDKGQDIAVDALQRLPADVTLVLAGGSRPGSITEFENEIDRRVAARGLSGRVIRTGYLTDSDLLTILRASSVQLVTHRNVAASGSLALGLSCGKAIVASDLPHAREISGAFGCPRLFRSGDAEDLSKALEAVLSEPRVRAELESRARACAEAYSWERVAQLHLDVYRRLVARREATPTSHRVARRPS